MAASRVVSSSSVAVGLVVDFLLARWRVRRVLTSELSAAEVTAVEREAVAERDLVGMLLRRRPIE